MKVSRSVDVVILAAGYATRLYPLTLTTPKPLLPIADKAILEHIVDDLASIEIISKVYIVGNEKFSSHFEKWLKKYSLSHPTLTVEFVNDGSTNEQDKRGAIGSLDLVIQTKKLQGNLLVIAGDNLFGDSLRTFIEEAIRKGTPFIGTHDLKDKERTRKFGMIALDQHNRVIEFIEKPEKPNSSLIAVALYYYPASFLPFITTYLTEGNNPDQPGRLIEWLYTKTPVYGKQISDMWFDIGSPEMLEEADRLLRERIAKTAKKNSTH